MRIDDILYFAPNLPFMRINWEDKESVINAFQSRINEFYLIPAEELNRSNHAFACGILCVTTIDYLAKIETGDNHIYGRFVGWVKSNIIDLNSYADRFYKDFRNGLVHEARIKNAGQFSYDSPNLVMPDVPVMVINPGLLIKAIRKSFENYISEVRASDVAFYKFKNVLLRDFQDDYAAIKNP